MHIVLTAKFYGAANALVSPAKELLRRGHDITVYATGNDAEAKGFQDLPVQRITTSDFSRLVQGYDVVVTGLSGYTSPDGQFVQAATKAGIPVVSIADQNSGYVDRLGSDPRRLPTVIAVMDEECKKTLESQLDVKIGAEAVKRVRVVGWTAFDRYAELRDTFTEEARVALLTGIGIDPESIIYVHFTQNMHPDCVYMSHFPHPREKKQEEFDYELDVAKKTFEAASDLGLKLVVKPHPGEEFDYTKEQADHHGFLFVPRCNTQLLVLVAYSVTAGRSTCLTEATLLDRNTGGLLPDMGAEWVSPFPPLMLGAIPYTQTWEGIKDVLAQVTSKDEAVLRKLKEDRKKFSVDGNTSKRLVDIIEELC